MSIYGVSSDGTKGILSFKSLEEDGLDRNSDKAKRQDLDGDGKADNLDGVTLTDTSRTLARLIQQQPGVNIVESMTADLEDLQNRFMETLEEDLALLGVDVDQAFTLKRGEDGLITVVGDHPDKEAIEAVANSDLQLSEAFETITEQSKLIAGVQGNARYKTLRKGLDAYLDMASGDSFNPLFTVELKERSMQYGLAAYL